MLETLPSASDVIAIRLSGKLGRKELDPIVDRLEAALAEHDKTHVYAEVTDFGGIEIADLLHYLGRALPFFRKLDRFGRVAVVSDQAWLRAAAKVESALLPHVSYETFTLAEREQALAWVEGRSRLPHGAAFKLIETDKPGVIGYEIDGRLSAPEMKAIADHLVGKLDPARPVRVLARVRRLELPELGGFDAKYLEMKRRAFSSVERYAIVGGPAWLAHWASFLDALTKADIRHFDPAREAEAWEWLGAQPRSERELA
jgi:hypothetical protein